MRRTFNTFPLIAFFPFNKRYSSFDTNSVVFERIWLSIRTNKVSYYAYSSRCRKSNDTIVESFSIFNNCFQANCVLKTNFFIKTLSVQEILIYLTYS